MAETLTDWKKVKLGDVCSTTSGGTPSRTKKEYYMGNIPWIKSGELNDGYIFDSEERISEDGLKNSSVKLLQPGTLLIAMYGATAGKTAILKVPATTNQAICAILENDKVNIEFVRYAFLLGRPFLLNLRHGGAQPNLNQTNINSFEIDLPPLSEQKSIAKKLGTVQEAISGQEELVTKLKELKRSMMQYLFTHGTKGEKTKMTEIGEVPESWEVTALGKVCKFEYGKGLTEKDRMNGNIPVYGSNGIVGYHDQAIVKSPGIVIGRKGSVGAVHYSKAGFCPIDTTFFVTENETSLDLRFLFYLLQKFDLKKLKADVGVPGINREMAYRGIVATPKSKEDQQKVAKNLDLIQLKIEVAQEKLSEYQGLFKTLLHELMAGERRTKAIHDKEDQ